MELQWGTRPSFIGCHLAGGGGREELPRPAFRERRLGGGGRGGEKHTLSSIVTQATMHLSGDQARRRNPTGHMGWERLRKERKVERHQPSPSLGLPEHTEEVGMRG